MKGGSDVCTAEGVIGQSLPPTAMSFAVLLCTWAVHLVLFRKMSTFSGLAGNRGKHSKGLYGIRFLRTLPTTSKFVYMKFSTRKSSAVSSPGCAFSLCSGSSLHSQQVSRAWSGTREYCSQGEYRHYYIPFFPTKHQSDNHRNPTRRHSSTSTPTPELQSESMKRRPNCLQLPLTPCSLGPP